LHTFFKKKFSLVSVNKSQTLRASRRWLALPSQFGQPVLETAFPTAFQRLDIRDGDLGVSMPGNQAKRRAVGWVLQNERISGRAFRGTSQAIRGRAPLDGRVSGPL
jgi:hypothetical protein